MSEAVRLTQYARGGGCACKIPPGELDTLLAGLSTTGGNLLVGAGDDAAAVREGRLDYLESGRLLRFYEEGLHGYTYLEDPYER